MQVSWIHSLIVGPSGVPGRGAHSARTPGAPFAPVSVRRGWGSARSSGARGLRGPPSRSCDARRHILASELRRTWRDLRVVPRRSGRASREPLGSISRVLRRSRLSPRTRPRLRQNDILVEARRKSSVRLPDGTVLHFLPTCGRRRIPTAPHSIGRTVAQAVPTSPDFRPFASGKGMKSRALGIRTSLISILPPSAYGSPSVMLCPQRLAILGS